MIQNQEAASVVQGRSLLDEIFQRIGVLGISLILGINTIALCVLFFLTIVFNPRPIQNNIIVRNGTSIWLVGGADAIGLSWRSAEQTTNLQIARGDLDATSGQWTDGSSDGWCKLLPAPVRSGALAVGWPLPWIIWRFSNEKKGEWFPRSFETANQVEEIESAAKSVLDNGQIAMNLKTFSAAAISILTASAVWWILIRTSQN